MTAPVDTPIFFETIIQTGINPYTGPTATITDRPKESMLDVINRAPRPGQKPTTRRKRK